MMGQKFILENVDYHNKCKWLKNIIKYHSFNFDVENLIINCPLKKSTLYLKKLLSRYFLKLKYFVLKERGRLTSLRRENKLARYRKARKLQMHLTLSQGYKSSKTIAGTEGEFGETACKLGRECQRPGFYELPSMLV